MTARELLNYIGAESALAAGKGADKFHAGDGSVAVRSVVVTFTATRSVLQEAVRLGANLIITHEPTYYTDDDPEQVLAGDAIYENKKTFIHAQGLTIWRCHDWWHRTNRDGILTGVARQLGWLPYQDSAAPKVFHLPPTTLETLAASLQKTLSLPALRVIGDPMLPVRDVGLSCGCPGWAAHRELLGLEGVNALVCGELREWETCEYVRDSFAAGRKQGLIVLGHCSSEEGGMRYLADWLRPLLDGIPVHFVPAGDPFRYV